MQVSGNMLTVLEDLYASVHGAIGAPVVVCDVHHSTLYALERRALITIDTERTGNRVQRFVALTEEGRRLILEAGTNAEVPSAAETGTNGTRSKRVTIAVQVVVDRAEGAATLARVERYKRRRRFVPVLCDALALYEALERGSYDAITALFPEVMVTLYADVRRQIENDILQSEFVRHLAARVVDTLPTLPENAPNAPKIALSTSA